MSDAIPIKFNLNGRDIQIEVQPQTILTDLLRDTYALTGTKIGCDQATCGACTVLVDDEPTNLQVLRPADAIETAECWMAALAACVTPTILALTRQAVPTMLRRSRRARV